MYIWLFEIIGFSLLIMVMYVIYKLRTKSELRIAVNYDIVIFTLHFYINRNNVKLSIRR